MVRQTRLLFLAALTALCPVAIAATDEKASPPPAQDQPRGGADIERAVRAYEKAFNQGDPKAVAELWSDQGAYENRNTGERTIGRDAVFKDMSALFKAHPKARLAIDIERIRLIRPDVARVEGTTDVFMTGQKTDRQSFSAIYVKQDGQWLIDNAEEFEPRQPQNAQAALSQLDWMVGRWVDETDAIKVNTDVRWSPGKSFLIRSYLVETEDATRRGTQVIGWDPINQQIRSWIFDADGGFGEGTWSRSGNEWLVRTTFTTNEGDVVSGTQVITRMSDQRMKVQTVGQELNGEPEPSREPVTVVRVSDQPRDEAVPAPQGVQR